MSSRKDDVWEITSTICGSSQARADYARNFKSIFLIPPGPFTNPSKFREKSKFVASFIIWKPHWIDEETFLHLFHLKPKPKRPRVRRRWVNNPTLMRLPVPRGSPVPQWCPPVAQWCSRCLGTPSTIPPPRGPLIRLLQGSGGGHVCDVDFIRLHRLLT